MTAGGNRPAALYERLRSVLRGTDRAEAPALPVGEALHPVTLAAIALLVVNDWVLKPRFGPSFVTGKLSDLAGLVFAPVVLSAAIGLALVPLRRWIDPSLSRRRLLACVIATGVGFAAVKLDPGFAAIVAHAIGFVRHAAFYPDLTDLWCLPALLVALWIGRDELARVPLGRPAAIHRLARPALPALRDVAWAGREVTVLAAAIDAWDAPAIDAQLSAGRGS